MNFKNQFFVALLAVGFLFTACKKDEVTTDETDELQLNLTGLEDLGTDFTYEGWIMVDGSPVSTGVFDVNDRGELSKSTFDIPKEDLEKATAFILTIEPLPDSDPAPSAVKILAGNFDAASADLAISHEAAIGDDFANSTGDYILATPTNGMDNDETSGVWWLNNTGSSPSAGLDLPTLPDGWKYEGWAVIDGQAVSTGTFTDFTMADDAAIYSGTEAGPNYPGEDFIMNAPEGLSFPTDLTGMTVVISVEPSPDNSPSPFLLKPLVASVPANAPDHSVLNMDNNATATNPTGIATRTIE